MFSTVGVFSSVGVFSTVGGWDIMVHVGDIFSTVGHIMIHVGVYLQYRGGVQYSGGMHEYRVGIS